MIQIKILATARYKKHGSNSEVQVIEAGQVIARDDEYAAFLISQGLAELVDGDSDDTAPEMALESPERDDGLKQVVIPPDGDNAPPGGKVEPVGANLEREGKVGKTRSGRTTKKDK